MDSFKLQDKYGKEISSDTKARIFLALFLLNTTCPVLANSVDPDQLASGSQLIWICTVLFKYVNFYQKPGSSNLIGWKLEVGVTS